MTRGDQFSFAADSADVGIRLDVFLALRLDECSRSFASQLISNGAILVNGITRKPGYRVRPGDRITGRLPPPQPSGFLPEPIPLSILYEDPHIVVVDKPPGLVVHPAPGHYSGTLVNGLLHHCPDLEGIGAELRPGIVHRLDKDTSGVLVVAKNAAALEHLSAQFRNRSVKKDYLALVKGEMPGESGVIRLPIGRHPVDRKRMSTRSRKGREAHTAWRLVRRWEAVSLLELALRTGRTHQIRVHLAAIGRPIIGDPVYGRVKSSPAAADALLRQVRRQMLHAWRLEIIHPQSGDPMRFESPLPQDMEGLIAALEAGRFSIPSL